MLAFTDYNIMSNYSFPPILVSIDPFPLPGDEYFGVGKGERKEESLQGPLLLNYHSIFKVFVSHSLGELKSAACFLAFSNSMRFL
jgi:hypothetical protein